MNLQFYNFTTKEISKCKLFRSSTNKSPIIKKNIINYLRKVTTEKKIITDIIFKMK